MMPPGVKAVAMKSLWKLTKLDFWIIPRRERDYIDRELLSIEDEERRTRVLLELSELTSPHARGFRGYLHFLSLFVVGFLGYCAAEHILYRVLPVGPLPRFAAYVLGFAVPFLLAALVYSWLLRRRIRHDVRQYLLGLGCKVCLHCGYDLRGQTQPRCPECGSPFDPGLLDPAEGEQPS
jgi:hypothetical protein